MKSLKVLNKENQEVKTAEVLINNKTNYYNVFLSNGRICKSYKSLKMVEKYLNTFGYKLA